MIANSTWQDRVHGAFFERERSALGDVFQRARINGNRDRDARLLQQAKELIREYELVSHLRIHNTSSDRSPVTIEDRLRTITGLLAENRALLLAAFTHHLPSLLRRMSSMANGST